LIAQALPQLTGVINLEYARLPT